ncbi:MAG: right-handed parallel beta-helix repeat-containing protein [Actinobacteria bacterium]|nr:right-handed parallel beta-helix repeat-containing protein [Actinomycetota bacterium]
MRAVLAVALMVPIVGFVGASPAHAVVPPCGSTITQDTTLTGDMTCPGDGLFVGAPNITLDLNGHTITGPGPNVRPSPNQIYSGVNILFGRTGVTVTNGTIRAFTIGATTQVNANGNEFSFLRLVNNGQGMLTQFNPSTGAASNNNVIHDNTIEASTGANGPAVWLQGDGHTFHTNTVRNNQNSGLTVTGDGNTVSGNDITANTFLGVELRGGSASTADRNSIVNNRIWANEATGIAVNGDENRVSGNTLAGNRGNGINVGGPSAPRRWVNNRIQSNSLSGTGRPDQQFPSIGLFAAQSTHVVGNRIVGTGRGAGIFASGNSGGSVIATNQLTGNTDGINVSPGATSTTLQGNQSAQNTDDGIDVDSPSTTLVGNLGAYNGDLGIEAVPGVVDGGGNRAFGNGNQAQCSPSVACAS